MNFYRTPFILILSSIFFYSCLFDGGSDHIVGDYYIGWIDVHQNRTIYKEAGEGVIPATVFAVGYNDNYIFAKHIPYEWQPDSVVKKGVSFYIIERTENFYQDAPVYGPLNKKEFDSLLLNLNIPESSFSMTYKYD